MNAIYKNRVRKMRINPEKEPEPVVIHESENEKNIDGWLVKWRDWQWFANQDGRIGVWMAYPPMLQGWCLYSSYPGKAGAFYPNSVFDCSIQDWQTLPTLLSTEADLAVFKAECLERLKEVIWQVGPPPYDPYAKQREEEARYATS